MSGKLGGCPGKPGSTGETGEVQRREQTSGVTPERHPGVSGMLDELQSPEKSVAGLYVCVGIGASIHGRWTRMQAVADVREQMQSLWKAISVD